MICSVMVDLDVFGLTKQSPEMEGKPDIFLFSDLKVLLEISVDTQQ